MGRTADEPAARLLTIREAAEMLHVHLVTLRRWEASGLISAVRIGPRGHRRFRTEDLNALIAGATPGARPAT